MSAETDGGGEGRTRARRRRTCGAVWGREGEDGMRTVGYSGLATALSGGRERRRRGSSRRRNDRYGSSEYGCLRRRAVTGYKSWEKADESGDEERSCVCACSSRRSPSPRYPTSRGSCQLRSLPCSLAANVERSWERDAGRGWRRWRAPTSAITSAIHPSTPCRSQRRTRTTCGDGEDGRPLLHASHANRSASEKVRSPS